MKNFYKLWAAMVALLSVSIIVLWVNAQSEEVSVEITSDGTNSCVFQSYAALSTGFSYSEQTLNTTIPTFRCILEDDLPSVSVTVTALSLESADVTQNIPAANVKIKQSTSIWVTSGDCVISSELGTSYTDVSSATTLFAKDDHTICTVDGDTQVEITVPASLPVSTYSGNMVFLINE